MDANEAQRILAEQDERSQSEFSYPDRMLYTIWGVAYLIGYLPLALSADDEAVLDLPLWFALGTLFVAIVIGIVLSIVVSARHSRGLRGENARKGMLYGLSWWFSFLGVAGIANQLGDLGVDGPEVGVVINGVAMMIVAAMFMAGGVIWLDTTQFVVGVCISVTTVVALFLGLPAYYWIMAFGVGGLLLAVATVGHTRLSRAFTARVERHG